MGQRRAAPEPQLVEGEWADAAFAEVLGESELDDEGENGLSAEV